MTERSDLMPTGKTYYRAASYTYRCGWVDWGHAQPGAAKRLLRRVMNEQSDNPNFSKPSIYLEGKPAFVINFGLRMGYWGQSLVTNQRIYVIRKGLSQEEKKRVALAIFIKASVGFERLQGRFPYAIVSGGSSFSGEDLISNVIGFYGALKNRSVEKLRGICGEVSVEESLRIWDEHLGEEGLAGLKRYKPRPVYFPVKAEEVPCGMESASVPSLLSSIKPAAEGDLWVRPDLKQLAGADGLLDRKRTLQFKSNGQLLVYSTKKGRRRAKD